MPANGAWTYALTNGQDNVQALEEGQSVTDTFTATVTDDFGATASQMVTVTIAGTNDSPMAVADANTDDAVVEAGVSAGNPTAIGNVLGNDTDVDAGAAKTVNAVNGSEQMSGGVSTAPMAACRLLRTARIWMLIDTDPDTNALAKGAMVSDTFRYTVSDEFGATSIINVNHRRSPRSNDVP